MTDEPDTKPDRQNVIELVFVSLNRIEQTMERLASEVVYLRFELESLKKLERRVSALELQSSKAPFVLAALALVIAMWSALRAKF